MKKLALTAALILITTSAYASGFIGVDPNCEDLGKSSYENVVFFDNGTFAIQLGAVEEVILSTNFTIHKNVRTNHGYNIELRIDWDKSTSRGYSTYRKWITRDKRSQEYARKGAYINCDRAVLDTTYMWHEYPSRYAPKYYLRNAAFSIEGVNPRVAVDQIRKGYTSHITGERQSVLPGASQAKGLRNYKGLVRLRANIHIPEDQKHLYDQFKAEFEKWESKNKRFKKKTWPDSVQYIAK